MDEFWFELSADDFLETVNWLHSRESDTDYIVIKEYLEQTYKVIFRKSISNQKDGASKIDSRTYCALKS